MAYCSHGMAERRKYGVVHDDRGWDSCRKCGGVVRESIDSTQLAAMEGRADAARVTSRAIPLLTIASVPGREINEVLGLVEGIGHPGYQGVVTTTETRGRGAMDDARKDLTKNARLMGADAVVGVVLSTYSGGNRAVQSAMGVHLLGTAVTLADTPQERGLA